MHKISLMQIFVFIIPTRYPFKVEFTKEDAREAIESAKVVLKVNRVNENYSR